jgi:hypothetical protein
MSDERVIEECTVSLRDPPMFPQQSDPARRNLAVDQQIRDTNRPLIRRPRSYMGPLPGLAIIPDFRKVMVDNPALKPQSPLCNRQCNETLRQIACPQVMSGRDTPSSSTPFGPVAGILNLDPRFHQTLTGPQSRVMECFARQTQ